ncbi:MAG: tRNA(Ile)-lysidine synthase [Thermoleophilaceae bacterium]|jgi:tRNA(Ile)-lysidine synthase|nr:tRNA(Ile)-lysidine synthase [Thermoleophilaceae bacterium]
MTAAAERPLEAARASGLIRAGQPLLVMISGGADSICLLDVARRLDADVSALHVNYGLRAGSADDAELCRRVCTAAGVSLAVEAIELRSAAPGKKGNLQAEARERRYELAERHAAGADFATGHTASDQAETVLYRLAVSPGRRALLGMAPRRGSLVRPLLAVTRAEVRDYCRARGLEWSDDPSNDDVDFARARVRREVLPPLRELNPAVERAIAETAAALRDEAEVLDVAVDRALAAAAAEAHGPASAGAQAPDGVATTSAALSLDALRELPPALARLAVRAAAEAATGRPVSLGRRDADRVLALRPSGTATVELPGGVRAVAEYGRLRFAAGPEGTPAPPPEPARLAVPGRVRFGAWEVEALVGGAGQALLDAAAVGGALTVRAWRHGDRMRPAGLGGTKTLQDLFTDRKVPREERAAIPVVEAGGEIAWVAGVAVGERFRAESGDVVSLSAHRDA